MWAVASWSLVCTHKETMLLTTPVQSVCLSMVAADGVPSSDVREEGEVAKALFSPRLCCEQQAEEGCSCEVMLSAVVVLEEGKMEGQVCHGSEQWGRRQPEWQPGNKACGLTCSHLRGWIWKNCRCNSGVFGV